MSEKLVPAEELAHRGPVRFPNESAEYRAARTALLAEEIELRRHLERVAAQRRALPPGGEVIGDYRFEGENGKTDFAGLFGNKDTLVVYSFMFGAKRERPCPMCTNLLNTMEGNAADIMQKVALAVIAGSPAERLKAWSVAGGTCRFIRTSTATIRATISACCRMARRFRPITSSRAATVRSAISGVGR